MAVTSVHLTAVTRPGIGLTGVHYSVSVCHNTVMMLLLLLTTAVLVGGVVTLTTLVRLVTITRPCGGHLMSVSRMSLTVVTHCCH